MGDRVDVLHNGKVIGTLPGDTSFNHASVYFTTRGWLAGDTPTLPVNFRVERGGTLAEPRAWLTLSNPDDLQRLCDISAFTPAKEP